MDEIVMAVCGNNSTDVNCLEKWIFYSLTVGAAGVFLLLVTVLLLLAVICCMGVRIKKLRREGKTSKRREGITGGKYKGMNDDVPIAMTVIEDSISKIPETSKREQERAEVEDSNYDEPFHSAQNTDPKDSSLPDKDSPHTAPVANSLPLIDDYSTISEVLAREGQNSPHTATAANSLPLVDDYSTISEVLASHTQAISGESQPLYSEVNTNETTDENMSKNSPPRLDGPKGAQIPESGESEIPIYSEVKKKNKTGEKQVDQVFDNDYSTVDEVLVSHSAGRVREMGSVECSTSVPPLSPPPPPPLPPLSPSPPPPPPPHTSEMNELQDPNISRDGSGLESGGTCTSTASNSTPDPGGISAGPDSGNVLSTIKNPELNHESITDQEKS